VKRRISVVCLDVDGTVTDGAGGPAFPGAAAAVRRLRAAFPVALVTNTTSLSHAWLARHLAGLGLLDEPESLWTPAMVARQVLAARGHNSGLLLAEDAARPDFEWFRDDPAGPAVVVATEAHGHRVSDLQPAFQRLLAGASFYTLQRNRYYKQGDSLVTDLGPIVAFLEYASGKKAETLGKPSPLLYDAVAARAGVTREEIVMVGDDVEFDVAASVGLGMQAVLVRTGKYRAGDEVKSAPPPTATLDIVNDLPAWLGIG
jgi:HAD superfamily hydrolase (TIGR01458 family)